MDALFKTLFFLLVLTVSATSFARGGAGGLGIADRASSLKSEPVIVKWVGVVKSDGPHSKDHNHAIEFKNSKDGKTYDIVDSDEILKVHCEKQKDLLVNITAEKTPRFLFWGGNLIVKSFSVIEELAPDPHKVRQPQPASDREVGGAGRI